LKSVGKTAKLRYEEMLLIASQTGIGREKIDRDDLEALTGTLLGLSWPALARALGDLSKGGTASTLDIFDYLNADSNARYEDGSYEAVACRDGFFASARPEENVSQGTRAERYRAAAPHFLNFAEFWATESTCASWAVPPRPVKPLSTTAGAKILVIGNTLDLRTPMEWSSGIASQLGAKIVAFDDYVHTATFSGEPCITDAANNWLTALANPPAVC
jgi:TAP-like protein